MGAIEDKIKELIDSRYGSIPKFADVVGIPSQTIYSVLRRGIGSASVSSVLPIMAELGIDSNWIVKNRLVPYGAQESEFVDVPLLGRIAAGTPIEMDDVENTFPIPRAVHDKWPDSFLLIVDGDSMNKDLPNGSYALIKPVDDITHDRHPYAVCVNGYDATIKRVHKLNNGFELIPNSTDPTYKTVTYNYNEPGTDLITVIGEVVWFTIPYDWSF